MRTNELVGPALDWAVAKAAGYSLNTLDLLYDIKCYSKFNPSTDWSQGGPIIDREKIGLFFDRACGNRWRANHTTAPSFLHESPLIAAMRCYCYAKLGDTIDLPEELA